MFVLVKLMCVADKRMSFDCDVPVPFPQTGCDEALIYSFPVSVEDLSRWEIF